MGSHLSILSLFVGLLVTAWLITKNDDAIRWMLRSQSYKNQVLALPKPADGYLKHVEWDGWGFAGAGDTVVYLVFDPNNSLAPVIHEKVSAKVSGIPCAVPKINRLESQWYTVLFYTDTDWEHCASAQ